MCPAQCLAALVLNAVRPASPKFQTISHLDQPKPKDMQYSATPARLPSTVGYVSKMKASKLGVPDVIQSWMSLQVACATQFSGCGFPCAASNVLSWQG